MRFSLGSILAVSTIIGVSFGLVVNQAHRRQRALDALVEMGGEIYYEHQHPLGKPTERVDSNWGRQLLGAAYFDRVRSVNFLGSTYYIPDVALAPLSELGEIRFLYAPHADIQGADFAALKKLTELEALDLSNTRFNDSGMECLSNMSRLQKLHIRQTSITDAGLASIAYLKNLVVLDLSDTAVTDKGLTHLKNMPNLGSLRLDGTNVTGSGLRRLTCQDHLEELSMQSTKATSQSLKGLSKFRQLTYLNLEDTYVDDSLIGELRHLSKLRAVELNWTLATTEGTQPVADALRRTAATSGARVADSELKEIERLVRPPEGITHKTLRMVRKNEHRVVVTTGWFGPKLFDPEGEVIELQKKDGKWTVVNRTSW